MSNQGVFQFVDKMIGAKELIMDYDFAIVSQTVMTEDYELLSVETATKRGYIGRKKIIESAYTPFPQEYNEDFVFFLLNEEIDVGLATDLGLGVVKMLTGKYRGEHLIYLPFYGQGITKQWDDINEIIAIKVYLQLKHPEIYFESLDKLLREHRELIEANIIHNAKGYINRLYEIFDEHVHPLLN